MIEFIVIKSISVMSLFLYSNQSQIDVSHWVHKGYYNTCSKRERSLKLFIYFFFGMYQAIAGGRDCIAIFYYNINAIL